MTRGATGITEVRSDYCKYNCGLILFRNPHDSQWYERADFTGEKHFCQKNLRKEVIGLKLDVNKLLELVIQNQQLMLEIRDKVSK
jgi:hypothetical protein